MHVRNGNLPHELYCVLYCHIQRVRIAILSRGWWRPYSHWLYRSH